MELEVIKVRFEWRWKPSILRLSRTSPVFRKHGIGVSWGLWHVSIWGEKLPVLECRACGARTWEPRKHKCTWE